MTDPKHTQEGMDDAYANRPGPKRPTAALAAGERPADLTWFWEIVDRAGLADVPSDEKAALALLVQRVSASERRGIERAVQYLRERDASLRAEFPERAMAAASFANAILALSPSHVETAEERQAKIVKYLRERATLSTAGYKSLIRAVDAIDRGDFDQPLTQPDHPNAR